MKLCFIDLIENDYRADAPYIGPLGGTQAAACYLSEALAALGHEVSLWTNTSQPGTVRGVVCRNLYRLPFDISFDFDVVILMSVVNPNVVERFGSTFPAHTRFVFWNQHAADQPAPQPLADPRIAGFWDAFALVSGWQTRGYIDRFGIPPYRIHIMRNAASPYFADLFSDEDAGVAAAKGRTPVLAYSSAPYRGLDLAADIFPRIRKRVPDAEFMVFSGPPADAAHAAGAPFDALCAMDGVTHVGSLPQAELARRLRQVSLLLYPNTFAETSCISVIEALAAGCRVVTSNLGALPETTAGFGVLLEPYDGRDRDRYLDSFAEEVCSQIAFLRDNPAADDILRLQVAYARLNRWEIRAREWEHLFRRLCETPPRRQGSAAGDQGPPMDS